VTLGETWTDAGLDVGATQQLRRAFQHAMLCNCGHAQVIEAEAVLARRCEAARDDRLPVGKRIVSNIACEISERPFSQGGGGRDHERP
jgi:hypothetical protein